MGNAIVSGASTVKLRWCPMWAIRSGRKNPGTKAGVKPAMDGWRRRQTRIQQRANQPTAKPSLTNTIDRPVLKSSITTVSCKRIRKHLARHRPDKRSWCCCGLQENKGRKVSLTIASILPSVLPIRRKQRPLRSANMPLSLRISSARMARALDSMATISIHCMINPWSYCGAPPLASTLLNLGNRIITH